jgi:two-component system cell cycle sensor histidine kinase/response regulator CckA
MATAMKLKESVKTILVVDHERLVRDLAQCVLERSGYQVLMAEDGQAAIDLAASHPEVGAVLLDLGMPVMGGETAAPILRAHCPGLALILSSGYGEDEVMERFSRGLLSGFLQKPYTAGALLAKVAEVLSGPVEHIPARHISAASNT